MHAKSAVHGIWMVKVQQEILSLLLNLVDYSKYWDEYQHFHKILNFEQ